ncbi:MAG: HAD family hydrolase [Pseudomonadota bacterium]
MPVFRRCRSSSEVIRLITKLAPRVDLISFDVFDTLVMRRIMPPELMKVPAARMTALKLAAQGIPITPSAALSRRIEVEHRLRSERKRLGCDAECRIVDVVDEWLGTWLDAERVKGTAPTILAEEMRAELDACYPAEGFIDAVGTARAMGKRVVFASDMYLGRPELEAILDHCGYGGLYDRIYSSGEEGLNKRSGRLYRHILESEHIQVGRWVHFGDNLYSDFWVPRRLGGRSFLCLGTEFLKKRSRIRRVSFLSNDFTHWEGARFAELLSSHRPSGSVDDPAYLIGYYLLGPALCNFIHQVLERVAQERISLVLFPARDGFILKEIYRRLKPHLLPDRQIHAPYCFLSRRVVYAASVNHIGLREINVGFARSREKTLRNFLVKFCDCPEQFLKPARECGFGDLDDHIENPFEDRRFQRFSSHPEVLGLIRSIQAQADAILYKYLGQLHFWDVSRAAIVDVGWIGTVQDSLTRAFGSRPDRPRLFGLYFGHIMRFPVLKTATSTYEGLVYHADGVDRSYLPTERFPQLMEFATRAPHPTSVGLADDPDSGTVIPVFRRSDAEERRREMVDRPVINSMQCGILDATDAYVRMIPYREHSASAYTPFVRSRLERFLYVPRVEEGRLFSKLFDAQDFGVKDEVEAVKPPEDSPISLSWLSAVKRMGVWHEGCLASLGIPGAVTLFNLYRILKSRRY